jgi:hypothetical protein
MNENIRVVKMKEKTDKRIQIIKNLETPEIQRNAKADLLKKIRKYSYYANMTTVVKQVVKIEDLMGDIDLSIMKEQGMENVTNLTLENGNITDIKNIPESITHLHLQNNLLERLSFTHLLRNVKVLNVNNNLISDIDLTTTPHLTDLNVSNNQLSEIKNLPSTLQILNVSFNNISQIDLLGLHNLKSFICNNNQLISIKNIPKNLQEIAYYKNPLKEIQELSTFPSLRIIKDTMATPPSPEEKGEEEKSLSYSSSSSSNNEDNGENKIDYKDAIYKYFKLKNEYETSLKKDIKKIKNKNKDNVKKRHILLSSFKGKCVGSCKKNVGSIFTKKNNYYVALCGGGGKIPCNLNIKIYNGENYNFFNDMHFFKENTDLSKQDIIKKKMDVLFNFVNDKDAMKYFKSAFEKYKTNNASFTILYEKYQLMYNNPSKIELIHLKNEKINEITEKINELMEEYKKNQTNKDLLHNAIEIQINELIPEMDNLRNLKYEFVEMINTFNTGEYKEECKESVLVENEHSFEKFIYVVEEPKVIRW